MTRQHLQRWPSCLLCLCLWGITFSSSRAADVMSPIEKIVASNGVVYTCGLQTRPSGLSSTGKIEVIYLHLWNLEQAKGAQPELLAVTDEPSPRWSVAHQHCWIAAARKSLGFPPPRNPILYPIGFYCNRMELDLKTGLPDKDKTGCSDDEVAPLADPAHIGAWHSAFPAKLYYDYLSMSKKTFQVFVLTNIRGMVERVPPNLKMGRSGMIIAHVTDEECKTPKWSLTVFENTVVPGKEVKWQWNGWKKVETIEPLFEEEFQVVARADAYYFLTKSGKVYQSKKPNKSKERTMEAYWTDAEQPVVTFLVDSDNDRTFAFTKNKKKGEKDVYFELADKPKPVPYNLAEVKLPKEMSEPMKRAFPYAQILLNDGKIKAK